MKPQRVHLVLIACAAAVLVVALIVSAFGESSSAVELTAGQVYSTDDGDPIDVFYGPGDTPGTGCTNVGGFFYGSGISCFALKDVDERGTYVLAVPESARKPPLVVGVMPASASGATARVGDSEVEADTRGRWFLATLAPSALGPNNAARLSVEHEHHLAVEE